MKINMSESQYDELLNLAYTSAGELRGQIFMEKLNNDNYVYLGYETYPDEYYYENRNKRSAMHVDIFDNLLQKFSLDTCDHYASFHTRSSDKIDNLTREEINDIKKMQKYANYAAEKSNNDQASQCIEAVICNSELMFYYEDLETKKISVADIYVNEKRNKDVVNVKTLYVDAFLKKQL